MKSFLISYHFTIQVYAGMQVHHNKIVSIFILCLEMASFMISEKGQEYAQPSTISIGTITQMFTFISNACI